MTDVKPAQAKGQHEEAKTASTDVKPTDKPMAT